MRRNGLKRENRGIKPEEVISSQAKIFPLLIPNEKSSSIYKTRGGGSKSSVGRKRDPPLLPFPNKRGIFKRVPLKENDFTSEDREISFLQFYNKGLFDGVEREGRCSCCKENIEHIDGGHVQFGYVNMEVGAFILYCILLRGFEQGVEKDCIKNISYYVYAVLRFFGKVDFMRKRNTQRKDIRSEFYFLLISKVSFTAWICISVF